MSKIPDKQSAISLPPEMLDPITLEPMTSPVRTSGWQYYNRDTVDQLQRDSSGHPICAITRSPVYWVRSDERLQMRIQERLGIPVQAGPATRWHYGAPPPPPQLNSLQQEMSFLFCNFVGDRTTYQPTDKPALTDLDVVQEALFEHIAKQTPLAFLQWLHNANVQLTAQQARCLIHASARQLASIQIPLPVLSNKDVMVSEGKNAGYLFEHCLYSRVVDRNQLKKRWGVEGHYYCDVPPARRPCGFIADSLDFWF